MVPNRSELDRNCAGKCSDLDRNFTLPDTRWEPRRKVGRGSRATGAWNSLGHRPEPAASSAGTGAELLELCRNSLGTCPELEWRRTRPELNRNCTGTRTELERNFARELLGTRPGPTRSPADLARSTIWARTEVERNSVGTHPELARNSPGARGSLGHRSERPPPQCGSPARPGPTAPAPGRTTTRPSFPGGPKPTRN